ncbi:hypothetical protein BDP27DRAFT_1329352 [Rhodocollybia butyracea]|uniref:F-box domain-containing protein n=1 Tax=Rhodocollybia butyracea TaxID=206335 RepID=A0A9P5PSG3_9AGAR|nr:hypothetical protein BDP27DRAFT_1329352 [Rhodocollybia butyracea]
MASRLPVEVLGEIFVHCLPTDRFSYISAAQAPLLLTSICQRWREVALSFPSLWNTLHIFLDDEISPEEISQTEETIQIWLGRSKSLPLFISLVIDSKAPAVPDSLFEALMSHSKRFTTLRLVLDMPYFSLLNDLAPEFPALTVLSLHPPERTNDTLTNAGIPCWCWFPRMPSLAKFSLNLRDIDSDRIHSMHSDYKWANITELELISGGDIDEGLLSPTTLLNLLGEMPRLQSCLVRVEFSYISVVPKRCISLPHLHTMSIILRGRCGTISTTAVSETICAVAFPSVRTFSVDWGPRTYFPIRQTFFSKPLENLKHLRLHAVMEPKVLAECLSFTPNLAILEVVDMGCAEGYQIGETHTLQDSLLASLSGVSSSCSDPPLCPHLAVFRLVVPSHRMRQCVSNKRFLNFLQRKRSIQTPFSRLEICDVILPHDMATFSDAHLKRLRKLRKEGLQLSIRYFKAGAYRPFEDNSPHLTLFSPNALPPLEDINALMEKKLFISF